MTSVVSFLQGLIATSDKAAQISKIIRLAYLAADGVNLMATEEKFGAPRQDGDTDFKTLADVLCQSVIDADIRKLFPEIKSIRGEENGNFQTVGSGNVLVEIGKDSETTSSMLAKALPNNNQTVSRLSSLIHSQVTLPTSLSDELIGCQGSIDLSNVSIWIDPIDATKEYVRAKDPVFSEGMHSKGLGCITVLIGAYDSRNGHPVAGVVSRPFTSTDSHSDNPEQRWRNEIYWAYASPDSKATFSSANCLHTNFTRDKLRIAVSSGESMPFIVNNSNYEIISPRGAGNKVMTVVNGHADLYLLTTQSNVVYRWDMCAGHAILKTAGGGILNYKPTLDALMAYKGQLEEFPFSDYEIDYRGGDGPLVDGIVAYSQPKHLIRLYSELLEDLSQHS